MNDEDLDFVIQIWRIDGRSVYASRAHKALPSRTSRCAATWLVGVLIALLIRMKVFEAVKLGESI